MSDVNANINISIDSSQALGQLRALQSQISAFNQSVIAGNAAAAASQKSLTANLAAQIGATKAFTTSMVNVESSVSRLGTAIDKNKLSLGQYFRYGMAASGSFGKSMREHAEIMELAGDRVKRLQTQYVALGQAQNGMQKAMAIRPLQLHNADAAIGIQRQQIFNKLMHDGSTSMVNWGKNTQWAGRQLMVGFTVPLTIFGGIAGKIFMDLEKQIIQFKRVYGDLDTTAAEKTGMVDQVKELGKEFTKYGIAVNDTIGLAAKAAATGAQGADLMAITTEATRLATLGQIDYQQALDATISLQTAFGVSSGELAEATDFLNAVENQTVTSLDDITQAIPLVAPVIRGLGGDVKDLAVFLTAMREGGVNANEGANALKSGLASMINPTKAAREQLSLMKIDIDAISKNNRGDIQGFVMEFGKALEGLSKFERQQTLAKVFGKYQFARMGALFANISKEGSQAQRVIDLTGESVKNLAALSEGELGQIEEAVGVKFVAAVEKLKLAIAPVGESFLKIATPLIDFATTIADKFNALPDGMKTFITYGVAIGGVLIPAVVMVIGLFANFLGQMVKMGNAVRMLFGKTRGLGSALQYLAGEELDALAASASLEGQTNSLTGSLNVQRGAVMGLAKAYGAYSAAAGAAAANLPQGFRGPGRAPRRMATGGFVAGSGNKDSEPALLMPGEFVVSKKAAQANAPLLAAMNAGKLRGYADGTPVNMYGEYQFMVQDAAENQGQRRVSVPSSNDVLAGLSTRAGEARGIPISAAKVGGGAFDAIADELRPLTENFVSRVKTNFDETFAHIENEAERMEAAWKQAGRDVEQSISRLPVETDRAVARKVMGLDEDLYGTIPTAESRPGSGILDKARKGAFTKKGFGGVSSYATSRRGILSMWERLTGQSSAGKNIGHISAPRVGSLEEILASPSVGTGARQAEKALRQGTTAGVGAGAGTNSPSKITQAQGKDVAKGLEIGIEQGTPAAVAAAEKMGAQVAAASDPTTTNAGRQRRGASRPQGPANTYAPNGNAIVGGNQNSRNSPNTVGQNAFRDANANLNTTEFVENVRGAGKEAGKFKKSLKGMGGKLMGGMFAMDGLLFGMSMMENGVGEFAQKIMPAAFALQGVSMMLPMLKSPVGLVIVALGAVAAIIWKLKSNLDDVRQSGINMADAMISTSKQIQEVGEFFGNKNIVRQKELRGQGVENIGAMTKAQEYLQGESGKVLTAGFTDAFKSQGVEQASQQFANKLATMMLQGSLTNKQAKGMADALEQEMGVKGVSAKVKGKLTELVGPDGKDVYKHPIQVSFEIQENNQQAIGSLQKMTTDQIDEVMKNASERTKEDLMVLNADNKDLKLTPGVPSWVPMIGGKEFFDIDMSWMKELSQMSLAARDDTAKLLTTLTAVGAALGNNMKAGYDNASAAATRYAEAQKRAEAETDPQKKKYLLEQLKVEAATLKEMEKDAAKSAKKNRKWFGDLQGSMQTAVLGGNKTSLETMFKDTAQQPWLEDVLSRTGNVEKTLRYNIEMAMSSGQVSPFSLDQVYQMVNDDEQVSRKLSYAIEVAGADKAGDLIDQLAQTGDKELVKEIQFDLDQQSKTTIIEITEALEALNALPENIQKSVTTDTTNTDDLIRLAENLREFDKIPDKAKKERYARYFEENFGKVRFGLSWFLGLPASVQKSFLATYTIHFNETGGLTDAGRKAFANAYGDDLGYLPLTEGDKGKIVAQDDINQANASVELDKSGGSSTPSGSSGSDGGGGGGGDKADPVGDFKKAIAEKMRLYLNMTQLLRKVKKAGKGFTKELLDATKYNGSLADQLRDMNLSESLVADILSKGATDAKKIMDKLGKKGLKEQDRKMLAGIRGEQVSGFVGQRKASNNQSKAMVKLQRDSARSGLNQMDIAEIVSDEAQAEVLASLKRGSKAWNEYINKLKQAKRAAEDFKEAQDPIGYQLDAQTAMFGALADVIDTAFESQFNAIERNHQKSIKSNEDKIKGIEDEIEAIDREIDAIERLNDGDERRIETLQRSKEMLSRQIEQLERANELDQRKINDLQREDELRNRLAESIQKQLEDLTKQEDILRKSYDDRINALNDVIALNQHILDQQKSQLGLAQALSQGDVYAAAQAAQEMQTNQVQYAQDQMVAGLEQGRDNAVEGLRTANGQTREQAEAQIQAIRDQSYQTSLQIRDIEDQIYARNQLMIPLKDQQRSIDDQILVIQDGIYAREMEIQTIQLSRLQPRKDELQVLNDSLKAEEDLVEKEKEGVMVGGVTYEQWQGTKQQINDAFAQQEALHNLMQTSMLPGVQKYAKTWVQVGKAIEAAYNAQNGNGFNFDLALPNGEIPKISNIGLTGMGSVDWQAKMEEYISNLQSAAAAATAAGASVGKYAGGRIRYATGSIVGDGARDSVSAMLTPGEFVIRKASVDKYGEAMFQKINQGSFSIPRYSTGGTASAPVMSAPASNNINAPVYNSYSVNVSASTNASPDDIARTVIAKIKTIESSNIRRINGY